MKGRNSRFLVLAAAAALVLAACAGGPAGGDWKSAPDVAKAKTEGATLTTYGMPDDWANYGEIIKTFCAKYEIAGCNHVDTDMTSAEEIQRYDAEKNNPVAIFSDIGLAYGPTASEKGVVPPYLPPSASKLPADLKAKDGGWVATFVGVPSILVNLDALKAKNLPEPKDWADLANPQYKGLVGVRTPGKAGEGDAFFLALVYTTGGSYGNFDPGIALAKKIAANLAGQAGNAELAEKGEIPILIKYDFNNISIAAQLKAKGIAVDVFIPSSGSIYAPSGMMVNGYNTKQMNVAKLYMDYVLSDEAQTVFAKFGARPIRFVLGDLQLPAETTANWLSNDQYAKVQRFDFTQVQPTDIGQIWESQVLAGG